MDAPFNELPFAQRMEKMGDEAEGVFCRNAVSNRRVDAVGDPLLA